MFDRIEPLFRTGELAPSAKPGLPSLAADFPAVVDLTGLAASDGFVIIGDSPGDVAGFSVSSAGDVNGDGFDDVILGAPEIAYPGLSFGGAYVIFGKASGFGPVDLANLTSAQGFLIQGKTGGGNQLAAGFSVSDAGDMNGDGFDDVIVGTGSGNEGESYVVFGKAGGFSTIDVGTMPSTVGFTISGDAFADIAGLSVSSAGDINNDGFADVLIGAPQPLNGTPGKAYVVFGKASGLTDVDLGSLPASAGFAIIGAEADSDAGRSVAEAGDVNGDGIDDIVIGAPYADGPGGNNYGGAAYVVYGKTGGFSTVNLANLSNSAGFTMTGNYGYSGRSVSGAGDINGDGLDDLVIGTGYGRGVSYVVFGRAGVAGDLDLSNLPAANGFRILGDYDEAGRSVSSAGDVNGDGFDDIIIGAGGNDDGGDGAGGAYVVFGKASGFGEVDLSQLSGEDGFFIQGDDEGDFTGGAVAAVGDHNGDGFDDLIVGSFDPQDGGDYEGGAYVLFGRAPQSAVDRVGSAADQTIRGGDFDDTLSGLGGADTLVGGAGGDLLDGGAGRDWADYSAGGKVRADLKAPASNTREAKNDSYVSIENLRGSGFSDELLGNEAANRIEGLADNDVLTGRGGGDTLAGGAGRDKLKGGEGADDFELASLQSADADTILDFGSGEDRIALDGDVFGVSRVKASQFVVGNAAGDANDRLIYNDTNGRLFFDPDGTGAQSQVLIATLSGAPTLSAGDFIVI